MCIRDRFLASHWALAGRTKIPISNVANPIIIFRRKLATSLTIPYKKVERAFSKVQNLLLGLIGIALTIMMSVIMLQTLTRYVIFYSLPWSEELSRYLFVFVIMIGLTVAIKDDMLISIDLIDRFLPEKADKYLDTVRKILALLVSIIIVICCSRMFTIGKIQKSPAMGIPMITMYGTIFVSYILAAISLVFKIIDNIREAMGIENKGEEKQI